MSLHVQEVLDSYYLPKMSNGNLIVLLWEKVNRLILEPSKIFFIGPLLHFAHVIMDVFPQIDAWIPIKLRQKETSKWLNYNDAWVKLRVIWNIFDPSWYDK